MVYDALGIVDPDDTAVVDLQRTRRSTGIPHKVSVKPSQHWQKVLHIFTVKIVLLRKRDGVWYQTKIDVVSCTRHPLAPVRIDRPVSAPTNTVFSHRVRRRHLATTTLSLPLLHHTNKAEAEVVEEAGRGMRSRHVDVLFTSHSRC